MNDKLLSRKIAPKIYFPPAFVKPARIFNKDNKPEYYAGSKFTIYNKYAIIMIYAHAFHYEEAAFNFFKVCKPFRNLLVKNYKSLEN